MVILTLQSDNWHLIWDICIWTWFILTLLSKEELFLHLIVSEQQESKWRLLSVFCCCFSCLCYVNYTSNITNQNDQSRMPYFHFAVEVILLNNQDDKNNAERDGGWGEARERGAQRERGTEREREAQRERHREREREREREAEIHGKELYTQCRKDVKYCPRFRCWHLIIFDLHVLLCLYTM